MRFPVFPSLVLGLVLSLPNLSAAQAGLEKHLGPIAQVVELGQSGAWYAEANEDWFILSNEDAPGSIQYFWGGLQAMVGRDYSVSVNLYTEGFDDRSLAGLIFNRRAGDRYMAIMVASDGTAEIIVRTPEGFNTNIAPGVQARLDGSDVLMLSVSGEMAETFLNGEKLFGVEIGGGPVPNIGVIAINTGLAAFTDFQLGEPRRPGLPRPGGSGQANPQDQGDAGRGNAGQGNAEPGTTGQGGTITPAAHGLTQDEAEIRLGVTLGVFLHEFAHAVIGETGLPATGPEEDIADSFSAFAMASIGEGVPPDARDFYHDAIEASALLWYYSAIAKARNEVAEDWQGEHAPDIKRFRNAFCVIYGSNPDAFADVARRVDLNDRTRTRCRNDFPRKFAAWEELLATRGRNLGPDMPGAFPADQPGGKVRLTFAPVEGEFATRTEALLKQSGLIPAITQLFEQYFVWPRDLTVTFRNCDIPNAWYDPGPGSVTMCYAVIEHFSNVVRAGLSRTN